ncbi:MAG TPA: hypothetical protein VFX20_14805 [Steroidobacteraceae bacterium]|nr:hypothetical protein [Steroidobacteraceae bacterium]
MSESHHETERPSATVPDWSREAKGLFTWSPAGSLLASIRAYQHAQRSRLPWRSLARKIAVLRHRIWSVVTGADIPLNARIAGGLLLPHPNGVVVHPGSYIGPNCVLFQQVTLGSLAGRAPRLGGDVVVGAGAKLLGGISIGDHARIGANAVVLEDVPAGATSVGVPARIVSRPHVQSAACEVEAQKMRP